MYDVITIGSAVRDQFLKSKAFKTRKDSAASTGTGIVLPLGSKLPVDEIIFETGGGATNAAVTFARQGLKTACICRIGDDPGGKAILDSLEADGISTDLVLKSKEGYTGYSVILVTQQGERTVLTYRGLSANFRDDMIPKSRTNPKWIFISSLSGNIELLKNLVNWAEREGIKTAIIPGNAELSKGSKILSPIFAKTDIVIMNREEAAGLTGIDYEKKEKIAHKMCLLVKGTSVITDGPWGATACDGEYFYHIGTHGNKPLDRTGAGDAFASGFVAGLIKFEDVEGALELAGDNGSSAINFFGAKKGILFSGKRPFKNRLKITKIRIKRRGAVK